MKNKAIPTGLQPDGGAQQGQDEKKDHERHPTGRSKDSDFEDPQANQSKGRRKHIPHPNPQNANQGGQEQNQPGNNPVSGGNRRKVSPRGVDHN